MPLLAFSAIMGRASLARHKAGLTDVDPRYSTAQIIERAFPDVIVAGAPLPRGVTEMVEARGGRRTIWYNRRVPQASQRVGIMHGLHHLLTDLRTDEGMRECNLAVRELERRREDWHADPVERACDLFAGEMLVPFEVLDQHAPAELFPRSKAKWPAWDDLVDQLSSRFHVPVGFMRWRLYDLAKLRQTHFYVE